MNRTLRRPMFRIGGVAEGITSGLQPRQGYATNKENLVRPNDPSKYKFRDTGVSDFLINFGLDLASRPAAGNIFQQVATSAKDPFKQFQAARTAGEEREWKMGLHREKMDWEREKFDEQKRQFGMEMEQEWKIAELEAQGEKQFMEKQIDNYWDPIIAAAPPGEREKLQKEKAAEKYKIIVQGFDVSDQYKILSNEAAWMQAQTFDHLNKMNKKKAIYTVHGHNNFIKTDKGDINKSVWQQIGSIRNLLREVREDVSDMVTIQENRFKEIVEKLLNGEIPTNMTDKELKSIIKEIKNLDSMNLNFAISGGSVISSNHYFNEMENYVPYMYAFTDSLLGFINARDDLTNKLENYEKEHAAAVNKGDNVEAIKKSLMVKEANEMIDIYNDKINVTLGLKDRNETENMNAVQLIKFVAIFFLYTLKSYYHFNVFFLICISENWCSIFIIKYFTTGSYDTV